MRTPQLVALLGAIWAASACGGRTAGVEDSTGATGSNVAGGNSSVGGVGGAISSANGSGNTGNISTTGGASRTGGSSSTGGVTTTGGTSAWPCPTVCTATSCGIVSDRCSFDSPLIDCGFADCPQEICGKDAPNECPFSCSAKMDCKSAGNKDCGFISDGCGGIIDCGACSDPQCCGCGSSASPGVSNVCGSPNDACVPLTCDPGMCGPQGDGCGGFIDCGRCCTPWTCEDYCPADTSGNIRECSSVNDGERYICPRDHSDGCGGTMTCYHTCV